MLSPHVHRSHKLISIGCEPPYIAAHNNLPSVQTVGPFDKADCFIALTTIISWRSDDSLCVRCVRRASRAVALTPSSFVTLRELFCRAIGVAVPLTQPLPKPIDKKDGDSKKSADQSGDSGSAATATDSGGGSSAARRR